MLSVYFKIFAKLVGDSLIKPWLQYHSPSRPKDTESVPFTSASTKETQRHGESPIYYYIHQADPYDFEQTTQLYILASDIFALAGGFRH